MRDEMMEVFPIKREGEIIDGIMAVLPLEGDEMRDESMAAFPQERERQDEMKWEMILWQYSLWREMK